MHIAFPFSLSAQGTTATVDRQQHLRNLIEQLLFTAVGERLMRPEFGTWLRKSIFAPLSSETTSAVEAMVQGALQQHLSEELTVQSARSRVQESQLHVAIVYTDRQSGKSNQHTFTGTF